MRIYSPLSSKRASSAHGVAASSRRFSLLAILRRNQRENHHPLSSANPPTHHRPLSAPPPHPPHPLLLFLLIPLSSRVSPRPSTATLPSPFASVRFALPLDIPCSGCRGMHLSGRLSTYLSRCTGCPLENHLPFLLPLFLSC